MRRVRLYYPTGSWLHQIHPSAKLLLYLWVTLLLTVFPWRLNLFLCAALIAMLWSTRVPFAHYRVIVLLSLPVMVISPLLNGLWPPDPAANHVIGTLPFFDAPIYWEGLRRGVNRDLLFGGSLILTVAALTTTELSELADAPTYLGLPHVFGFTLAAMLRYLPEVANFLLTLYDVQESRGMNFYTRNPVKNFFRRTNIFIPLLVFQLSRASRMSNAMESRGFQIRHAPTLYALRPISAIEKRAVVLLGAVALVLTVLRAYTVFVPGDYPFGFGTF